MTRNGHVFSPKYTPKVAPSPVDVPPREKVVPTLHPQAGAFVSTAPIVTIVPSITKSTTIKASEIEASKDKKVVNE